MIGMIALAGHHRAQLDPAGRLHQPAGARRASPLTGRGRALGRHARAADRADRAGRDARRASSSSTTRSSTGSPISLIFGILVSHRADAGGDSRALLRRQPEAVSLSGISRGDLLKRAARTASLIRLGPPGVATSPGPSRDHAVKRRRPREAARSPQRRSPARAGSRRCVRRARAPHPSAARTHSAGRAAAAQAPVPAGVSTSVQRARAFSCSWPHTSCMSFMRALAICAASSRATTSRR